LWPVKERFEARCISTGTVFPPEIQSQCGIYAYKTADHALENINRFFYRGTFLGKVYLWGVVHKHRFGYRAQFAYPASLTIGVCCICKRIVNLGSEPFAIGWAAYHFTDSFSVSGFLCEACNEKYYTVDSEISYKELEQLTDRYNITIG
jgi:hypothetical protein